MRRRQFYAHAEMSLNRFACVQSLTVCPRLVTSAYSTGVETTQLVLSPRRHPSFMSFLQHHLDVAVHEILDTLDAVAFRPIRCRDHGNPTWMGKR